jgi:hypothetical protein
MLLNRFLNEPRTVQELKDQIAALTTTVKEQPRRSKKWVQSWKSPNLDAGRCSMIHKTIEDGNGNEQQLDTGLGNFLIWPPETPRFIDSAWRAADSYTAELCRRISRVRKNS